MPRAKRTEILEDQPLSGLEGLDQDPEPAAPKPRGRKPRAAGKAKAAAKTPARRATKAALRAKVQDEVTMYLSLAAAGWELRDPDCAAAATQERIAVIAERLTSMIARNDALLEMAGKSGIIGDIVALIHAAWPIGRAVWQAHGPAGTGHAVEDQDYGRYPAYAPAVTG